MPTVTHRVNLDPAPESPKQETPRAFIAGVAAVAVMLVGFFGLKTLTERDEAPTVPLSGAAQSTAAGETEAGEPAPAETDETLGGLAETTAASITDSSLSEPNSSDSSSNGDTHSGSYYSDEAAFAASTATLDAETAAARALQRDYVLHRRSFVADGRWMTQLSSKWVGIRDARQTTDSGSHTFYASDIWKEYEAATALHGAVRLLQSTDFGEQHTYSAKPAGEPLWVILYDPETFDSESDVRRWCESAFPALSGDDLKNVCLPRQARPPFSS